MIGAAFFPRRRSITARVVERTVAQMTSASCSTQPEAG